MSSPKKLKTENMYEKSDNRNMAWADEEVQILLETLISSEKW